ncbi:hypothetical protein BVG79_01623 [Ketogulonicigenium robustum]|uniref:Peptidase S1 domain-containing protein n=1 Tax=Ketogulonicigenium robustum TaxID=92947 RepID=A0A1W6P112_9RHOB|nr:trypsin-like peptidase domain-containing protein [Ketogulonicigenium robustum]ARO14967.1 hypothetical protein BVG79_01623 [Ketogulonicigenium robustum]
MKHHWPKPNWRRCVTPVFVAAVLLGGGNAIAQTVPAVGRIEINGAGHCSAVLIAPDQVLTAAHCLFDPATGARLPAQDIVFQAGFSHGRAMAFRQIRRMTVHPDHRPDTAPSGNAARSAADLALLQLFQPVTALSGITPLVIAPVFPREGAVTLVGYGSGAASYVQQRESCDRHGADGAVLLFACHVERGASGAPLLAERGDAVQIISLVSAVGQVGGVDLAVGVDVPAQIGALRAAFDADAALGAEPRTSRR